MIQVHFASSFAQDPIPSPPVVDICVVPLVIPVVDLEEDGIIPIFVTNEVVEVVDVEDKLELHNLAEPEVFLAILPVVLLEPVIVIVDLKDASPPVSDDDGVTTLNLDISVGSGCSHPEFRINVYVYDVNITLVTPLYILTPDA